MQISIRIIFYIILFSLAAGILLALYFFKRYRNIVAKSVEQINLARAKTSGHAGGAAVGYSPSEIIYIKSHVQDSQSMNLVSYDKFKEIGIQSFRDLVSKYGGNVDFISNNVMYKIQELDYIDPICFDCVYADIDNNISVAIVFIDYEESAKTFPNIYHQNIESFRRMRETRAARKTIAEIQHMKLLEIKRPSASVIERSGGGKYNTASICKIFIYKELKREIGKFLRSR